MNWLEKIEAQFAALSKAESRPTDSGCTPGGDELQQRDTACEACVSEPTANRICHQLAARGFPDFKP